MIPLVMATALALAPADGGTEAPAAPPKEAAPPAAAIAPAAAATPVEPPKPATPAAVPTPASAAASVQAVTIAVLRLEGNKGATDEAPGVTSLLASRLSESPEIKVITQAEIATIIGLERQKRLLAGECTDSGCMAELAGALGSRYVVTGRLDRFGERFVLTATLFDATHTISVAKPHADVSKADDLPAAATRVADGLRGALGLPDPAQAKARPPGPISVSLKAGSGFFTSLATLSPSGDVEIGFRFADEWVALLQVGIKAVRDSGNPIPSSVTLLPSLAGVRKLYFTGGALQPYWGVGLGIQLSLGAIGIFEQTGPLPSIWATAGAQYMFGQHFGLLIEGKTNVAQVILGLAGARPIDGGFNMDLTGGVTYRF